MPCPAPGARGQPGNHGGCPLARGWKCHAEAGQASSVCKQGLPGAAARAGTAGMAFQAALFAPSRGSSLEPPQPISRAAASRPWRRCPINHCGGKAPAPRFPVTRPHLLHHCISSRGEVSGHILPPQQRPRGSCWGELRSAPPDSGGAPHHQHCKSSLGRSSARAPCSSAQGARDGMGLRRRLR